MTLYDPAHPPNPRVRSRASAALVWGHVVILGGLALWLLLGGRL